MKLTANLKLKKPDLTDYVDVADINDNMDILDEEVGGIKKGLTQIEDLETENKTLVGAINELQVGKADKSYVDGAIAGIKVPVTSVNSKTGAVEISASDVGLGNVNNTSDINKPISTAQQNALKLKADKSQVITNVPANAKFTDTIYTHPGSGTNPHGTTKANVGLGSVFDYGIATTAEAQAGVSNVKYVTPALVKAAVQHLATTGGISMVKSVQRGVSVKSNSVTHASVNVSKSFIILDGRATDENYYKFAKPILATRTSTGFTITAADGTNNPTAESRFSWQVIEYV